MKNRHWKIIGVQAPGLRHGFGGHAAYIRYIANQRLAGIGMKGVYTEAENPLPWLDYMLNGVEHANFFENRSTEYAKASTTGNWQDIFK